MPNLHTPLLTIILIISSLFLISCGGESSGGGNTITAISGIAKAPGGTIAHFKQNKPPILAVLDFIMTPSWAAVTGLTPLPNATVELIRVDDSGDQVGGVLATTETDSNGQYTLDLHSGVEPAGDLVVQIRGSSTTLQAMVTSETVNIDPISQFILDTLVNDPNFTLAGLNVEIIQTLVDDINELEIDLSSSVTLEDAASILSENSEIGQIYDNANDHINESAIYKSIPEASIQLDGSNQDWADIPLVHQDPIGDQSHGGSSAVDLRTVKVATNNTVLFFLLETSGDMEFPHTPTEEYSKYDIRLHIFTDDQCQNVYAENNIDFLTLHGWGANNGDLRGWPNDSYTRPLTVANMGNVQEVQMDITSLPDSVKAIQIQGDIEAFTLTNGNSNLQIDETPYSVCYVLPQQVGNNTE